MALVDLKHVSMALGGPLLLDGVQLQIERGERICLLGRNGTGKSTLLRLLLGELTPDGGEIARAPGLRVAHLPQELPVLTQASVRDTVADGFAAVGLPPAGPEQSHLVEQTLTRADLDGDAPLATLSTGARRRALIARALVAEPDLLLLDEPTNHLDIDAIAWLERELARFAGTLFFVTHDRAFLRALAGRILELDRGRLRSWDCDYAAYLERRDALQGAEAAQAAEFDRKLAEEEAWLRQGIRARRTRNEGRVRALERLRAERQARREGAGSVQLSVQDAGRSGREVIRARGVDFAWGDRPILRDFGTVIARGDKVGILGPNGAGKTTLLRLLLGELTPAAGSVEHGTRLALAYYDQQREQLDETRSVQDNVTGGGETLTVDGRSVHVATYLQRFLFTPDQFRAPLARLSGGERNRLLLARLFARPANLLVLDEPTNDLDLETVELLEQQLVDFPGTLLLVSHDREFLDNVCTSTLVLEPDGHVAETVGGYADWARTRRSAAAAPRTERPARPRERQAAPRRLSFKEQRELEVLPGEIEALEAEQAALHARLADPVYCAGAGAKLGADSARLEALAVELAERYERWEALEALRS
ncbi:MAG: ATP-binding cassette domain-containing protein [Candidatus Krumholzibacteriia bacterium]|nr:ATP-binding cassette domain-containing protein [bacterium]MCB9514794.1 ATP-binding cassette domain-containing protein [Candidatus Latescibacterota bacterium]